MDGLQFVLLKLDTKITVGLKSQGYSIYLLILNRIPSCFSWGL